MTKNQIEYAKLLEQRRSNRSNEVLIDRRDRNAMTIAMGTLAETQRHNQMSERISLDINSETARHNQAQESMQAQSIAETRRSNLAREAETSRANLAKEQETRRANLAREAEQERADIAREVETRRSNTVSQQISLRGLEEQRRTNQAREHETSRHNLAQESETIRSAMESERIKLLTLQESERASRAHEQTTRRGQDVQASIARENISLGRYQTDVRDAREAVAQRETLRHNLASEGEAQRSHRADESISLTNARANTLNAQTTASKATSEKIRNYAMAASSGANAVSQIIRLVPIGRFIK